MIVSPDQQLAVTLQWGGDIDLDLTAFLLSDNGLVMDDGDMVFYNSLSRTEPYDEKMHGTVKEWCDKTRPMSPDGSVVGAIDVEGTVGQLAQEKLNVTLAKVNPDIRSVMICVTSCAKSTHIPPIVEAESPLLMVHNGNAIQLTQCDLSKIDETARAYEAIELVRLPDGHWSIDKVDEYHEGALFDLINKFV